MSDFVVSRPQEFPDQVPHIYHYVTDQHGHVWLYPADVDWPAELIFLHDPFNAHSQGFGGSILTFNLTNGEEYRAKGPWHSNAEALYSATGIDIRNTCRTYGCVAMSRHHEGNWVQVFKDVIYSDEAPVLGSFDRIRDMAAEFATRLGHPVACYSASSGGSFSGYEYPEGSEPKDWQQWFDDGWQLAETQP